MIQLNLLPEVKLEYLKAQRSRRLVSSIAVLVTLGSIGLLALFLSFSALQAKHLSDLNKDIKSDTAKLKAQPDVVKVLTVQNQLNRLSDLHASKPAAPRVFDFLNQLTPAQISINSLLLDFTQQQITITGSADALSSVNKYVDTLKFTKYKDTEADKSSKAFSNVVMTSYTISTSGGGSGGSKNAQPATFTVNLKYDPPLFDLSKKVTLEVPNVTTTRSAITSPTDLFQPAPSTKKEN